MIELKVTFGPDQLPLSEQLKGQFKPSLLAELDQATGAIDVLDAFALLTEAEVRRCRMRLIKRIGKPSSVREVSP